MKLLAMLPDEQKDQARVAVSDFTYTATDQSVEDAKKDAEDAGGTIKLVASGCPGSAIIVGAVLLVLGVVAMRQEADGDRGRLTTAGATKV